MSNGTHNRIESAVLAAVLSVSSVMGYHVTGIGRVDPFYGKEGEVLKAELSALRDAQILLREQLSDFAKSGPQEVRNDLTRIDERIQYLERLCNHMLVQSEIRLPNQIKRPSR